MFQEVTKPVKGACFGDASFTMEATSEMVGDDNGAGFSVETLKILTAIFIFGAGAREPEVDG